MDKEQEQQAIKALGSAKFVLMNRTALDRKRWERYAEIAEQEISEVLESLIRASNKE